MYCSFSNSRAEPMSTAPIGTPQTELAQPLFAASIVVESPESFRGLESKKRGMCGSEQEQKKLRLCASAPTTQTGGFSLSSELSIFDSDGLIGFPDNFVMASDEVSTPTDPEAQVDLSSCQAVSSPLSGSFSFSSEYSSACSLDNHSTCSSPSVAQTVPEVMDHSAPLENPLPLDSADTSMLQLTIVGMISCLRRVSDIASADPQLALQANLHGQVAAANELVASMIRSLASTSTASIASPVSLSNSSPASVQTKAAVCPNTALVLAQPGTCPIFLRASELETLWYADRPFPPIECELVSTHSNQRATHLSDCRVQVALLDGNGNPCDKLTGQASSFDFVFPVTRGVAEISGLRFGAVSSKYGGHFQLCFTLLPSPGLPMVSPILSDKIQVLSYRLFHAPKVDFSKLRASDPLTKVKGIGSLYAKRFAAIGVETVEHLADLDVEALQAGSEASKNLLECLRKDRGALTLHKLNELIAQARGIVQRERALSTPKSTIDSLGYRFALSNPRL